METQQCRKCKKNLPLNNFSKHGYNSEVNFSSHKPSMDKPQTICKKCAASYAKEYRKRKLAENPNYFKDRRKVKLTSQEKLLNSFISQRLSDAKGRARKNGKPFDIDKDYLKQIWTGKCALTNIQLSFERGNEDIGSLDCITPSKGYTKGNVQWVSWKVNRAKGDLTMESFLSMCRAIIEGATTIETTSEDERE